MSLVIVVSGPGGVGKGVIVERLVAADDRLWLSRSWTTRAQRPGEPDDAYVFVDVRTFEAAIEAGQLLEWDHHFGNWYGTPMPTAAGDSDVLLEIDVNGAAQVMASVAEPLLVFVDAPSRDDQRRRMQTRGDQGELITERLAAADRERGRAETLGYTMVVNDDVDRAVAEIAALVDLARGDRGCKD